MILSRRIKADFDLPFYNIGNIDSMIFSYVSAFVSPHFLRSSESSTVALYFFERLRDFE